MNEDIVKRGYVKVSATKGLGNSLSLRQKKYWVVLKGESRSTKSCIEIYKSEDDVRKSPTKLVAIDQISQINSVIERKELTLVMYAESVSLICSSRADLDDWLKDIESVRAGQTGGGGGRGGGKAAKGAISTPDEGPFRVRLRPSPSLLFHGSCILEIQKDFDRNIFNIALFADEIPPRLIVKWQIDHIRQYGSNEIAFKFQSGSKSPTNVDWFILDTDSGDAPRIHRAVDYWAHHIVEQANNMVPSRSLSMGTSIRPTSSLPASPVPPLPNASRSSSIPNGAGSGVYQSLIPSTVQPTPIYDGIDNRQVPSSPPPAIPPLPSSLGGSSSLYQPLTHTTSNGMGARPTQDYAGLSELTREPSQRQHPPPIPPSTSVPSHSAEYMGLNFSSRDQPPESTYMDLNVSKT